MAKQRADLTFRYNLGLGKHGWIRLTPAYSVKIVHQILHRVPHVTHVLDPFAGTGTTGLVCAEQGINSTLIDINPFLVWLAQVKTTHYTSEQLQQAETAAEQIVQEAISTPPTEPLWYPPIHNIQRWWPEDKRQMLAQIYQALNHQFPQTTSVKDLLLIAFCHLIIRWSNAAFNHQSMSFKRESHQLDLFSESRSMIHQFRDSVRQLTQEATPPLQGATQVYRADSRQAPPATQRAYDCVITSPPYPNRMSYIRELRPYMYWLGYLQQAREAGELDWQAIGGTWGIATSRLNRWQPNGHQVPYEHFSDIFSSIAERSEILAKYVHRYFLDITAHLQNLRSALPRGTPVFYVVGNSKFYDTLVPTERIYAQILQNTGFENVHIEQLRKRNSKKELFEFLISANSPS